MVEKNIVVEGNFNMVDLLPVTLLEESNPSSEYDLKIKINELVDAVNDLKEDIRNIQENKRS